MLEKFRKTEQSYYTCRNILIGMCSNPIIRALNLRFHWYSLMIVPPIDKDSVVHVIGPTSGWDTFHAQWKKDRKTLKSKGINVFDLAWDAGDIAAIL